MSDNSDVIGLLRDVLRSQEAMRSDISDLKTAVAVDVTVLAQHRDKSEARFDAIEKTLNEDIKPQTDDFKRMKAIGIGLAGMIALGGMSVGGMVVYAGDVAVNWVRHWLRIQ